MKRKPSPKLKLYYLRAMTNRALRLWRDGHRPSGNKVYELDMIRNYIIVSEGKKNGN